MEMPRDGLQQQLKQRGPVSPFLFTICSRCFKQVTNKSKGKWHSRKVPCREEKLGCNICSLQKTLSFFRNARARELQIASLF